MESLRQSRRLAGGSQRDAHKDDVRNLKQALAAMPAYWAALGRAFVPWLAALADARELDAHVDAWKDLMRATARAVVREASLRLGSGARALQAGAKADRALRRVLRDVLGAVPGAETAPPATAAQSMTTEGAQG